MKRMIIFIICIMLITTSILINVPMVYAADNDFTLSITSEQANDFGPSLSETEARNAVNNHGDIYGSDHKLILRYTPMADYNWTSADGTWYATDNQVVNYLRAKTSLNSLGSWFSIGVNHPVPRALMKSLGFLVGHDSTLVTTMVDTLTGNYNYLNDITYSETDGMTIGSDTVDKIKNTLQLKYWSEIGMIYVRPSDNSKKTGYICDYLKSGYEYEEDYVSDFNKIMTYDYSLGSYSNGGWNCYYSAAFNKSSYSYVYNSSGFLNFTDENLNLINSNSVIEIFLNRNKEDDYDDYVNGEFTFNGLRSSVYSGTYGDLSLSFLSKNGYEVSNGFLGSNKRFYSNDGNYFTYFKSFEALYNFVHGSQTAYVSSKVQETGQDIKLSIDDMNTDITSKLDEVIDSINNSKEGMTADELQNAIDKGLEDLKNDTGEIKDNTSDIKQDTGNILDVLKQQNDILLQILGVTEYIAYNNNDNKDNYTMADVRDCFDTMFSYLRYAILYGVNKTGQNEASTASYAAYSDVSTYSSEDLDYHNGLFGKFPFSVPYQLYEWLQVLQADPVAPTITYNYGFLIGHKNEQAYDLTFDFKQFDSWASVCKSFLRLSFTLFFAIGVYKKFKGEV